MVPLTIEIHAPIPLMSLSLDERSLTLPSGGHRLLRRLSGIAQSGDPGRAWTRSVDFRQTLPASPNASALARKFLDGWLTDLVGKDTADAARVAASEIVDNAVQHGGLQPDDTISLVGSATDEVVRVEVEQPTPANDVLVVPEGERGPDEGGFGLRIVEGLSSAWGVRAETPGAVWFEVDRDVRSAPAGRGT